MRRIKKVIALLTAVAVFCSTFFGLGNINAYAGSSNSTYENLAAIHRYNPSWSYTEYVNKISEISTLTSKEIIVQGRYINPYIYEKYGNLVVYGEPSGDFYETSSGKMQHLSSRKVGEYQFLGVDSLGTNVTNDLYFNPSASGGGFASVADYKTTNWQAVTGAEKTWLEINATQRSYLMNSGFYDDDYTGSPANYPATSLLGFLNNENTVKSKVYVQSAPTLSVGGSVRLEFIKPNKNKSWNTLTYEPMYPDFGRLLSGSMRTDKETYVIKSDATTVSVGAWVTGKVENCPANLLKPMEFEYYESKDTKSIITNANIESREFAKEFNRSSLSVGRNVVELQGWFTVRSIFPNDPWVTFGVTKTVEIIVEEASSPYAKMDLVAEPDAVVYSGQDMTSAMKMNYSLDGLSDTNKISDVKVYLYPLYEGTTLYSFNGTKALKGNTNQTVTLKKELMTGKETFDATYEALVTYTLTDGTQYTAKDNGTVRIALTPPTSPPPSVDNEPPVVSIYAPSAVYAGDEFTAYSSAYDPDDDPLTRKMFAPNGNIVQDWHGESLTLWYDTSLIDTTQAVIAVAEDWDGGAEAHAFVYVMAPEPTAKIGISGTLKQNRTVIIEDKSFSPTNFPVASKNLTIEPITPGITAGDIKYHGTLNDSSAKNVLFKKPGEYRLTLTVTNTAGYSHTTITKITIEEDKAPVIRSENASVIYRDPNNGNKATYDIYSAIYSPDNDNISSTEVFVRKDADNNGSFDNDAWTLIYSTTNMEYYRTFLNSIGKYQVKIVAQESFGQPTMSEFLFSADYLKTEHIQTVEVKNLAPSFSYSQKTIKKLDLVIDVDELNTSHSKATIESRVNALVKPILQSGGVNATVTVKDFKYEWGKYTVDESSHDGYTGYNRNDTNAKYWWQWIWRPSYNSDNDTLWLLKKIGTNSFSWSKEFGYSKLDLSGLGTFQEYNKKTNPLLLRPGTPDWAYMWLANTDPNALQMYNSIGFSPARGYYGIDPLPKGSVSDRTGKWILMNPAYVRIDVDTRYSDYPDNVLSYSPGNYDDFLGKIYYSAQPGFRELDYSYMVAQFENNNGATWYNTFSFGNVLIATGEAIPLRKGNLIETFLGAENTKISGQENEFGVWYERSPFLRSMEININNAMDLESNTQKVYALVRDTAFEDTSKLQLASTLFANDITFYGLGKTENSTSMNNVVSINDYKGAYLDTSNLDNALIALANDIVSKAEGNAYSPTYLTIGEEIETTTVYEDYEGDPQNATSLLIQHDPSVFDNSLGLDTRAGASLSAFPTSFDKVGKYTFIAKAQDRPTTDSRFAEYNLWSKPSEKIIYVHRKPIPVPVVTLTNHGSYYGVSQFSQSYDLDHTSRSDKGIVMTQWWYKEASSSSWISGMLPSTLPTGKDYLVKLEVTDMEYTSATKVISVSTTPQNNPPIAQFNLNQNPIRQEYTMGYGSDIVDKSFDPDGDPIVQWKWTVTKNGTKVNSGDSIKLYYGDTGTGDYVITLEVKDSNGAWSLPYSQTLSVVWDNLAPTLTITPPNRDWANTDMQVTIQAWDTGASGLSRILYAWSQSEQASDVQYTTVYTGGGSIYPIQNQEGIWYVFAQAVDNAGNSSPVVKAGPYKIDKTPPEELKGSYLSGARYIQGNRYYAKRGDTVTFEVDTNDRLSGVVQSGLVAWEYGMDPYSLSNRWGAWGSYNNQTSLNFGQPLNQTVTDNRMVTSYPITIQTSEDKIFPLSVITWDWASNQRGWEKTGMELVADNTPPAISATPDKRDLENTEAIATVTVADTLSGVKHTRYVLTESSARPLSQPWTTEYNPQFNVSMNTSGYWYLHVEATDNVDNVSYTVFGPYGVDTEGPEITIDPMECNWRNTSITPVITASEKMTETVELRYLVSDRTERPLGGWDEVITQSTASVLLDKEGIWYIHTEAKDTAGNIAYVMGGPYRIDLTQPELLTGSYVSGARHSIGSTYYAKRGDTVTFSVDANDVLSGAFKLSLRAVEASRNPQGTYTRTTGYTDQNTQTSLDFKPATLTYSTDNRLRASFPIELLSTSDGSFPLHVLAQDTAGNIRGFENSGRTLIADNTPPIILANQTEGICAPKASIGLTATDALSGVKSMRYAWSTGTATPSSGWTSVTGGTATAEQLDEGIFYLFVEATDNCDNVSAIKRFGPYEVIHNRPPTVSITGTTPSFLYEGDNLKVNFTVSDPDLDTLTCLIRLTKSGSSWDFNVTVSPVGGVYAPQSVSLMSNLLTGPGTIEITVTDPYDAQDTDSYSFEVHPLGITGYVSHTELWEQNRQKYNAAARASGREEHGPDVFFDGEMFVLHADTTVINPASSVTAQHVKVSIVGESFSTVLDKTSATKFDKGWWEESMPRWKERPLDFLFQVTYSNGAAKEHTVRIYISEDQYWRLRMAF